MVGLASSHDLMVFEVLNRNLVIHRGLFTVGTKIIADPEKCFQELTSEKLLIFFAGWALSGINYPSSNFQALLLLQDKLLESV